MTLKSQTPAARIRRSRVGFSRLLLRVCWLLAFLPILTLDSASPQNVIRIDVNLVNLFVSVQDPAGNYVTELTRDDFRVYEDDEFQEVHIFEKLEDVRSGIGLVVDSSGSMVDILPMARRGIQEFTKALLKSDDYFVCSFGTSVRLLQNFGGSAKRMEESLASLRAWGTSVFYDALSYAVDKVSESKNERKTLIVFTDGHDNGSEMSLRQVGEHVQQSPVMFYFVAVGSQKLIDRNTLDELAASSGGRTLYVGKNENIPGVLESIRTELSKQYYLGYYVPRRPGFHRIRVETPGRDLKIRAKTGYFGG